MKPIFVESEEKELKYFIFGCNEKPKTGEDSCIFKNIKSISEKAFYDPWNLRRVYFDDKLKEIKKEAFEDCTELEIFCCGKLCKKEENDKIKGLKFNKKLGSFVIETKAFSGCEQLHTVILPKCKKLIIEKDAFKDCKELRTVVCLCNKISFTENPFADCPESLVFVGKENSDLERFARENGYRYVDGK